MFRIGRMSSVWWKIYKCKVRAFKLKISKFSYAVKNSKHVIVSLLVSGQDGEFS